MPEFDSVLEDARRLGEQLVQQPRVQAFAKAAEAIDGDAEARRLLEAYQRAMTEVQRKQMAGKAIEVADKQALVQAEAAVAANEVLKEFTRAQADYVELMDRVNRSMHEPIAAALGGGGAAK